MVDESQDKKARSRGPKAGASPKTAPEAAPTAPKAQQPAAKSSRSQGRRTGAGRDKASAVTPVEVVADVPPVAFAPAVDSDAEARQAPRRGARKRGEAQAAQAPAAAPPQAAQAPAAAVADVPQAAAPSKGTGRAPRGRRSEQVESPAPVLPTPVPEPPVQAPVAAAPEQDNGEGASSRRSRRRKGGAVVEPASTVEQVSEVSTPVEKEMAEPPQAPAVAEPAAQETAPQAAPQSSERQSRGRREVARPTGDPVEIARQWLGTLFGHLELAVDVAVSRRQGTLHVDIDGADAGQLLGAKGNALRTIEALQVVLGQLLGDERHDAMVELDVAGFKKQRQQQMQALAESLAQTVGRMGRAVTIAGLGAFDRRQIHQSLGEEGEVKTESEGVGLFRKLRVEPRKGS